MYLIQSTAKTLLGSIQNISIIKIVMIRTIREEGLGEFLL